VIAALTSLGLWSGEIAPSLRPFKPIKKPNPNIEYAKAIWGETIPAQGSLVEVYLASRGITIPTPNTLRFHPSLKHPDGGLWPAMVARVDRGDRDHVALHRTFLKPDGSGKAPVPRPKLMLGPCAGGAVRLSEPAEKLAVGEGIETCLSVLQAAARPVWAALSTSGLKALELPDIVREIALIADADAAGEEAAVFAGRKWKRAGLAARIVRPAAGYKDFNDMLLRSGGTS
jgi:hypothetical protein